jgi:hypothetical protein
MNSFADKSIIVALRNRVSTARQQPLKAGPPKVGRFSLPTWLETGVEGLRREEKDARTEERRRKEKK